MYMYVNMQFVTLGKCLNLTWGVRTLWDSQRLFLKAFKLLMLYVVYEYCHIDIWVDIQEKNCDIIFMWYYWVYDITWIE